MSGLSTLIRRLGIAIIPLVSLNLVAVSVAQAKLVATETIVREEAYQINRVQVLEALDREDVQQKLVEMGVDPSEARLRIAALSDAELEQAAKRIQSDPTGEGPGIVGVAVTVAVVLLITDLLCITNLFGLRRC